MAVANPETFSASLGKIESVVEDKSEVDEISFSTEGSNTGVVIVTPNNTTEDFSIKRDATVELTVNSEKAAEIETGTDASTVAESGSPAAAVTRIYTGKPDGTVIIPAMVIKASAPADFKNVSDMPLNLLYKNGDNWVVDKDAKVELKNGQLNIPVAHYSQFSAGLLMAVKTTTAPSDSTFFIEKSEFGEYNKMVSVEFTYNATFLNNKDLDKAVLSVPYGNAAKDYLKNCLGKKINADGGLISFKKSYDVKVDEGMTLKGVNITVKYAAKEYVVYYLNKGGSLESVSVTVLSVKEANPAPLYEQSHGHGHGNGNNAGGGIFGK